MFISTVVAQLIFISITTTPPVSTPLLALLSVDPRLYTIRAHLSLLLMPLTS
jgi:hypothetical protein